MTPPYLVGAFLALAAAILSGCATSPSSSPAKENLPFLLGAAGGCALSSDQASMSAHGTLRLLAASDRRTVYADLRSGKTLTLATLLQKTSAAFAEADGVPSGTVLGTIGAAGHGGKAAFVADGQGGLAVVYDGDTTAAPAFSAGEVETLEGLLQAAR